MATQDSQSAPKPQDPVKVVDSGVTVTVTDSGTTRIDTYVIQANDSVSHYALNLWRRNPALQEMFPEGKDGKVPLWGSRGMVKYLVDFNNKLSDSEKPQGWQYIKAANGKDCDGNPENSPKLREGRTFVYPEMVNEILNPGKPCAKITEVPVETPFVPAPPPIAPAPEYSAARTPAQFVPAMAGAVDLGIKVQEYNFLYGTPPIDAAARGNRNADRVKGGALVKGEVEGSFVKTRERDDDRNPQTGVLRAGETGEFKFTRADKQELLFRPQANYQLINGQWTPNKRFNQKLEENLAVAIDGDGRAIEVLQGNAMISLPRRNDPYHKGFFTDFDTASNVVNQWNSTGEAVGVVTFFRGLNEAYAPTADRFLKGTEAPVAADAEKVLDLNVRLALSPITWSVSQRGVPATDPTVLRTAMQEVLDSPRFAALPAEDQQRLRDRYNPLIEKMNNPDALYAAVGGREGTAKLYNPQEELAVERSKIPHIRDRYFDMLGAKDSDRPKGMSKDDYREQKTLEAGLVIVRDLEAVGQRPPSKTEREVGVGVAFNRERQTDDAITTGRVQALTTIKGDPALLDDVITHTLTTPGALQKWTDPVFHATRAGADDNRKILGFKSDGEADRYSENAAIALSGDKRYKKSLRENVPSIFDRVGNIVTFGAATPGANRNQNRGIADGFPEIVRDRWVNGTDEDRAQIRSFFTDQIDRSVTAQEKGLGFAAASQLTSLDPRLAEYRNGNVASPVYAGITEKLGTLPRDLMIQRGNATDYLGAQVEIGTEKAVLAGKDIRTVSREQAQAGLNGGEVMVEGGALAGTSVAATVFNIDVAKAAREAGTGAARSNVLTEANSPSLTGQGQNDRQVAVSAAKAQSAAFSMVVLQTLTNPSLSEASQRNLSTYINNIDKGGDDSSLYADTLKKHARAYEKAGSDPAKRAAAENAAFADFSAYFAGAGERPGARDWAVNRLGEMISKDGPLATAFTDEMRVVANSSTGLNSAQTAQLQARLALANTPEDKAAALNSFIAELSGGQAPAAGAASLNGGAQAQRVILSGPELSAAQIDQIAALGANPPSDPAALNAAITGILGNAVPTDANLQTLAAALSAGNVSPESQNAIIAGIDSTNAGRQAALDAANGFNAGTSVLTGDTQSQLAALSASNVSGDEKNAGVDALLAAQVKAGGTALNADQIAALKAGVAGGSDSLKAAVDGLNAGNGNGSLNAGNTNGLNAGNGSLNAGNSALNAGVDSLLSLDNNQSINSFNAGQDAGMKSFDAKWGVSWRQIVATAVGIALVPPGGGDPLLPNLPGFPCCTPAPGVPRPVGIPGGII